MRTLGLVRLLVLGTVITVAALLSAACAGDETPAPGFTPVASFVPLGEELVPVEVGFADANGARLYYEVYGEGEPLLLIPGFSFGHGTWAGHVPVYASGFQVIVFDPRGTGQSSFPEGIELTVGLMADDAVSLLDALGVDAAHVYGLGLGSNVALDMALRYPERIGSLILGEANPGSSHKVPAEEWAAAAVAAAMTQGVTAPNFLEAMFSPAYLTEHRSEAMARFEASPGYPPPFEVMASQIGANARYDVYDRLPGITAPTLILNGADDPLTPAENARILTERIPGAELVLLEGARAEYKDEKQEEADAAVLEFLRAHSQQTD